MNHFLHCLLIINHEKYNKSLRTIYTKAVNLTFGSLNEVRTRVLALRGLRPRPLVDEAIISVLSSHLERVKYYHERIFLSRPDSYVLMI